MTPAQYIAAAPESKREVLEKLHALIRRTLPRLEPFVMGNILGYGKYHYRYPSGHEGDACRVGLSSTKTGFSLYVCLADESGWLPEQAKARLGKVDVGKSCVRFKRLADLNLPALEALLAKARRMKAPGETTDTPSAKAAAKRAARAPGRPKAKASKKKSSTKRAARAATPKKASAKSRRR